MIILTCANVDVAPEEFGKWYSGFSFKSVILKTVKKAEEFGYIPVVYDLGSLGIGEPFHVDDQTFSSKGHYEKEIQKGYKSRSLFKPDVVGHCLSKYDDLVVYLDGDAQLCGKLDEIVTDDYDVGVTLRDPSEFESKWYRDHEGIVKFVNAGVIFFNPTKATKTFINTWQKLTQEVGNDQKALNKLTCPERCPEVNSVHILNGVRVKYFPGKQYNYYYFDEGFVSNIKIMHFKGTVRRFYPFGVRNWLYCFFIRPALKAIRNMLFYK